MKPKQERRDRSNPLRIAAIIVAAEIVVVLAGLLIYWANQSHNGKIVALLVFMGICWVVILLSIKAYVIGVCRGCGGQMHSPKQNPYSRTCNGCGRRENWYQDRAGRGCWEHVKNEEPKGDEDDKQS